MVRHRYFPDEYLRGRVDPEHILPRVRQTDVSGTAQRVRVDRQGRPRCPVRWYGRQAPYWGSAVFDGPQIVIIHGTAPGIIDPSHVHPRVPVKIGGRNISTGIAGFPSDEKTLEKLFQRADEAMYFSKTYGRNLITLAGRIGYLKARNIFIILGSIVIVVLSVFVSYQFIFKDALKHTFRQIEHVKITTKPKNLDIIILRSGEVYEGKILEETDDRVVISLYLEQGEANVVFKKSELSSIKYGSEIHPDELITSNQE